MCVWEVNPAENGTPAEISPNLEQAPASEAVVELNQEVPIQEIEVAE